MSCRNPLDLEHPAPPDRETLEQLNERYLERAERDLRRTRYVLAVLLALSLGAAAWSALTGSSAASLVGYIAAVASTVAGCLHGQHRSWVSWDRWHVARDRDPGAPQPPVGVLRLYPHPDR